MVIAGRSVHITTLIGGAGGERCEGVINSVGHTQYYAECGLQCLLRKDLQTK